LGTAAETLPDDHKIRQKCVQEKLRTGDAIEVAEVIRDLSALKRQDHLTSFDTRLLEKAQQFLACEVALVEEVQVSKAERMISETLDNGVGSPEARGEEVTKESTVTEIYQPIPTNRKIQQLAKRAMKRLHQR
jgi:hypothetical protein